MQENMVIEQADFSFFQGKDRFIGKVYNLRCGTGKSVRRRSIKKRGQHPTGLLARPVKCWPREGRPAMSFGADSYLHAVTCKLGSLGPTSADFRTTASPPRAAT